MILKVMAQVALVQPRCRAKQVQRLALFGAGCARTARSRLAIVATWPWSYIHFGRIAFMSERVHLPDSCCSKSDYLGLVWSRAVAPTKTTSPSRGCAAL